jgi:homoserine O-acetyltransferase
MIGFAIFTLFVIGECVLSMKWNRAYFTTGLPVFMRRNEQCRRLDDISLDDTAQKSKTVAAAPLAFRRVASEVIAFRESAVQYVPVMRGAIRHDPSEPCVKVVGYLNWSVIALAITLVAVFRKKVEIFVPAFFLVLAVVYLIQAVRFYRVAKHLIVILLFAAALHADEHDFIARDVHFTSGETLAEVKIHYATVGTPKRDASGAITNAVLILHGTGGSHKGFLSDHFGGVLDANKYFIVMPDNIGHGSSTKPSDGLHARFPHYGYTDMVELQHRLIVDGLGINHLVLVMGTSMGGMQTWMWGERYPGMMDALMPLASQPAQISGRNRVWRKMIIDMIRNDPTWNGGDYVKQPQSLAGALDLLMIATSSPLQWQKSAPTRDTADKWYADELQKRLATYDANDFLYAIESSRDYDPEPQLESITAPLLAINSADDFVNPPELKTLEALIRRVKHGRAVVIPVSDQTRGHGTHSYPAVWEAEFAAFMRSLPPTHP